MTNADIQHAIAEGQQRISRELNISASEKRQCLWAIAMFNTQTIEDQHGITRMRDPRVATSAIAELNKMDGAYDKKEDDLVTVNFIQHFGDDGDD